MRPASVTVTGVAISAWLPLDLGSVGPNAGIFLDMGAACTGTVEVTADDIFNPAVVPIAYASGVATLTGATTDVAAALNYPARAVRLNQSAGAALSRLTVVQKGII